ncbi:SDR family NAD(P)-dependent oxidoreductase [Natrinema caseinilyticum]|uniref:SDR family NAD(P)-dependent oxidoreductase n=1 Tax=Natrinema caseinilyticum TaxID=2961570 RepID=UPI0020C1E8B6|nr:SDR family NAD(P)-dependent oxidoreductase [Natrinema caseinilyticum]
MADEIFSVDASTAIVTGGSGGIGASIAERFVENGANVVVCSREQTRVDEVAETIDDRNLSGDIRAVECDVTDRPAVDELVEAAVDQFGSLDVLVNNAGASFMAPFEELSENGWKTIVDINLHGTFHCTQAATTRMKEHGGGSIVNISSSAAIHGAPLMTHYGAAKAGMLNLTRTLAYELADHDIRVNCIAPGIVVTEGMESQMGFTADDIDRMTVKRRVGLPEEIADVSRFLASPAASYLTGETITVGGVPRVEETHEFSDPYAWS